MTVLTLYALRSYELGTLCHVTASQADPPDYERWRGAIQESARVEPTGPYGVLFKHVAVACDLWRRAHSMVDGLAFLRIGEGVQAQGWTGAARDRAAELGWPGYHLEVRRFPLVAQGKVEVQAVRQALADLPEQLRLSVFGSFCAVCGAPLAARAEGGNYCPAHRSPRLIEQQRDVAAVRRYLFASLKDLSPPDLEQARAAFTHLFGPPD